MNFIIPKAIKKSFQFFFFLIDDATINKENFYLGAVSLGYLCPAKNFWKNVKSTEKQRKQRWSSAKTPSS